MKNVINFILFQIGWFACALGAGGSFPYLGPLVVGGIMVIHFWKIAPSLQEFPLILKVMGIGVLADTGLALIGAIDFGNNMIAGPLSPPFMIALWGNFAMTLNHSMSWLKGKYLLGIVFGAIGGPVAYYAGAKLGALNLAGNSIFSLGAIGLVWGSITLGILYFFLERPQDKKNTEASIPITHSQS